MGRSGELLLRSLECYCGVYFPFTGRQGNRHRNNTWVSTETIRRDSEYFFSRHHEPINDYRHIDIDISSPYLTRFVYVLLMTFDCALHYATGDCYAVTEKWCLTL